MILSAFCGACTRKVQRTALGAATVKSLPHHCMNWTQTCTETCHWVTTALEHNGKECLPCLLIQIDDGFRIHVSYIRSMFARCFRVLLSTKESDVYPAAARELKAELLNTLPGNLVNSKKMSNEFLCAKLTSGFFAKCPWPSWRQNFP